MSLAVLRRGARASSRRRTLPPLPTANLIAHYDAGLGVTTSAGRVTSWADQSSNGRDATEATSGPYVDTDAFGRANIRFASADSTFLAIGGYTFDARNLSVFLACRGAGGVIFGLQNYSAAAGHLRTSGSPAHYYSVTRDLDFLPIANPMSLGFASSPTGVTGYTNIADGALKSAVTADADCLGAWLGRLASTYGTMALYEAVIYQGAVDLVTADAVRDYLAAKHDLRTTAYVQGVTFEGDSITAGSGQSAPLTGAFPMQVVRPGTEDWRVASLGTSGANLTTLTDRAAATDAYLGLSSRNVLAVLIGRNDITAADNSAAVYSSLVTYVQARVTAGWEVWVGTLIASGASSQPTIDALNAKIRGTSGNGIVVDAGADRVIDFAALPEFADTAAATNTTYYQGDATHPTAAGAALMADLIVDELAVP